jgi:hypothetical protein
MAVPKLKIKGQNGHRIFRDGNNKRMLSSNSENEEITNINVPVNRRPQTMNETDPNILVNARMSGRAQKRMSS